MKIVAIKVYQVDLPLVDGSYKWADGKSVGVYDSTVVVIHTDHPDGIVGYGETVPLGPNYLPSYSAGVRCGIRELGDKLLGQDPTQLHVINDLMDYHLKGHPYVKSPLDMACWDILGKVSGLPLCVLLGGAHQDSVLLYRAISQGTPEEMVALVSKYKQMGYTRFQLKLGGSVDDDIARIHACHKVLAPGDVLVGDANTGWLTHHALKIARETENLSSFYMEQPCRTYEECLTVRKHVNGPFILDENISDIQTIAKAWQDHAADVVNIKISKFGGITRAKQATEFCSSVGIAMTVEDTWGGDIATAAILHLASSVPQKLQFSATDFNSYNTVKSGRFVCPQTDGVRTENGQKMTVPRSAPGLGVEPNWDSLKLQFTIE